MRTRVPSGGLVGLLSVNSGNFLEWYVDEGKARRELLRIVLDHPEALQNLALVPFDAEGNPMGESIVAGITRCQGEVRAFTTPAAAWQGPSKLSEHPGGHHD